MVEKIKKAADSKPRPKKPAAKAVAAPKQELKKAEKLAVKESTEKLAKVIETEAIADTIVEAEKEIGAELKGVVAKAGKRSTKSLKAKEAKAAKQQRKAVSHAKETAEAHQPVPVHIRSHIERKGKKFREAAKLIEKSQEYSISQAMELAVKTSPVKFDATVELHIRLNVDPRQSDQNVRANLVLPSGTGKTVRIAVLADAAGVTAANKAGADLAGSDEFLQQLDKNVINFDILITTPSMMPKLGKYARVLGPKGLMPNPKSGTITNDIIRAVTDAKAGRVEYRVDSTGIVHVAIGKVSFGAEKLEANARAVFDSLKALKPAGIKGGFVLSVYTATSMGPSIKIANNEL